MIGRRKIAPVEVAPSSAETPAIRTIEIVAAERASAQQSLTDREDDLQAATVAYEMSLDAGRDEALTARDRLKTAEIDRDIARRTLARVEAEHAAMVDAARLAAVSQIVGEADDARGAYEAAVRDLLPEMGRVARALIRLWAEAEIAHERAVTAIKKEHGADEARRRPSVEAFRVWPGRARELVGQPVTRVLWTNGAGVAFGDEFQERIREQPDGSGRLFNGGPTFIDHKRTFRMETYLPAQDPILMDPLVSTLCVPGVAGADMPGWKPMENANPRTVLELLDHLEQPSVYAEDRRQIEVEDVPVGLAVKVSRPAASFHEGRSRED